MLIAAMCLILGFSVAEGYVRGPWGMASDVEDWAWRLQQKHVINMTVEIIKDATYKLHHADKIQDEHKGTIGYELGTISAGILERFLYMLKLYRKYANIDELSKRQIDPYEYSTALHNIQGAYHEIQLEKVMFYELLRKHKGVDQQKARENKIKEMLEQNSAMPPGMSRWLPKPETSAGGGLGPGGLPQGGAGLHPTAAAGMAGRRKMAAWAPARDPFDVKGFELKQF